MILCSDGRIGVHIIVTMCDVGEGAKRYCDIIHFTVTSHTSHLRLSQGVRENSTWRYSHGVLALRGTITTVNSASSQERYLSHSHPVAELVLTSWMLCHPWLLSLLYKQIELQQPASSPRLPGLAAAAAVWPVIERQPRL